MSHSSTVVFDLETTGLSPAKGDRIIEIGAVKLAPGQAAEEFHSLIHTDRPINYYAAQVHGITSRMLQGHPPAHQVIPRFAEFCGDSLLVAHNAKFDINFLRHEFQLCGIPFRHKNHCSLIESRKRHPHLPDHKLPTVYRHLVGPLPPEVQLHRALHDARLAAEVWRVLVGE